MSTTPEGTSNPEAPNPQLPIAQKVRVRYAKRGRLRFTSHRDIARAMERAVRRANLPVAYSSGFTPHPKLSYAGASPTGAASESEYLEIGLTRTLDPSELASALNDALPPGLDVLEVVESAGGSLAERLQASRWRIELPGADAEAVAEAVARFAEADEVIVERMTKKGLRKLDASSAVLSLSVDMSDSDERCAILDVVVRHDTPSVRPDDVIVGLRLSCGLEFESASLATRVSQGPLDNQSGVVGDPLTSDRDASS